MYVSLSLLYFGLPLAGHAHRIYGGALDPQIEAWALSWWPHALTHRLNPFVTHAVWPAVGYNMTWTTGMPAAGLALAPVTALFGVVASYNLLIIVLPAAAAWSAFLLCRHVTDSVWPSLVGGYLFGFSQYVLAQSQGHLHMLFIFPIPLATYLVLLRSQDRIGRARFLAALVGMLAVEFLCSTEVFATSLFFGGLTLGVAWLCGCGRARMWGMVAELALACALAVVLVSPYLYFALTEVPLAINPSSIFSNDLLGFVVPASQFLLRRGDRVVEHFTCQPEQSAYLGPVFAIMLMAYAVTCWRDRRDRCLISTTALIAALSLGPQLHVAGTAICAAPALLLRHMPLLKLALPCRLGAYFFLGVAISIAAYLSRRPLSPTATVLITALGLLFLAPAPDYLSRTTDAALPAFFQHQYLDYLAPGDNIIILPYDQAEPGLLWQTATDFYFNLAAVHLTLPPPQQSRWPVLRAFLLQTAILDFERQLSAFLGANQVKSVIVDKRADQPWLELLDRLGWRPLDLGGVWYYSVPSQLRTDYKNATPLQMSQELAASLYGSAVVATDRYLSASYPMHALSATELSRRGLLNLTWASTSILTSHGPIARGPWLKALPNERVCILLDGDYQELEPLYREYCHDTNEIRLQKHQRAIWAQTFPMWQLFATFDTNQLRAAAARFKRSHLTGTGKSLHARQDYSGNDISILDAGGGRIGIALPRLPLLTD